MSEQVNLDYEITREKLDDSSIAADKAWAMLAEVREYFERPNFCLASAMRDIGENGIEASTVHGKAAVKLLYDYNKISTFLDIVDDYVLKIKSITDSEVS